MPNIQIKIRDKIPKLFDNGSYIVTHNSDYTLTFFIFEVYYTKLRKEVIICLK